MQENERLKILKTVSLFSETADDILAPIAASLQEIHFHEDEPVFKKGDPGDCMYIIAGGQVRVHDGDRTIAILAENAFFGEFAVLDPEFRNASVTTEVSSVLYRLDRDTIQALINDHPDISIAIIRSLVKYLRTSTQNQTNDFVYIRQFNQVISAAVAVEQGVYQPESLDETAERSDSLGQLARVFRRMVGEVQAREQSLKKQLAELKIEIDSAKKLKQVAEVTETEYFQELRKKAAQLRQDRAINDKGNQ